MRQKKGELLDLLRKETGSASIPSSTPRPTSSASSQDVPQAASSTEQLRFPGSRPVRRPIPWVGILAAAVPLLFVAIWAAGFFEGPANGLQAEEKPLAMSQPAETTGPEAPVVAPQPQPSPPVKPAPVAAEEPLIQSREGLLGIQVITYDYTERNISFAKDVAMALKKKGLPSVRALLLPADQPKQIVIYVGEASEKLELAHIRGRVRAIEYPAGSGERPFASALTAPLPTHIQ